MQFVFVFMYSGATGLEPYLEVKTVISTLCLKKTRHLIFYHNLG